MDSNMAITKLKTVTNVPEQNQEPSFATLDIYASEVKRLLLKKYSDQARWIEELVAGDMLYLEREFEKKTLPIYAAFVIYATEAELTREPVAEDQRLKLVVSESAKTYLQQLVKIGLWGESIEDVATTLIQQELASKLEAGLLRLPTHK
jgi:hypothetical protein